MLCRAASDNAFCAVTTLAGRDEDDVAFWLIALSIIWALGLFLFHTEGLKWTGSPGGLAPGWYPVFMYAVGLLVFNLYVLRIKKITNTNSRVLLYVSTAVAVYAVAELLIVVYEEWMDVRGSVYYTTECHFLKELC